MVRALITKEFRESAALAAIALGLTLFLLVVNLAESSGGIPLKPQFVDQCAFVLGGLAIALAIYQSNWEKMRGTYHFLLHRPRERRAFFATKIVVGLALLQLTAAVPFVCDVAWVGMSPKGGIPLEAWMAEPAWRMWLCLPVVYLAAFLSGLLMERWLGTGLLPLLAGGGFLMWIGSLGGERFVSGSAREFALGSPGWPAVLLLSAVLCAALLHSVFYVASARDFG